MASETWQHHLLSASELPAVLQLPERNSSVTPPACLTTTRTEPQASSLPAPILLPCLPPALLQLTTPLTLLEQGFNISHTKDLVRLLRNRGVMAAIPLEEKVGGAKILDGEWCLQCLLKGGCVCDTGCDGRPLEERVGWRAR